MPVARLILAAGFLATAAQAEAADIDILAAPEIAIPEANSGWYARIDAPTASKPPMAGRSVS